MRGRSLGDSWKSVRRLSTAGAFEFVDDGSGGGFIGSGTMSVSIFAKPMLAASGASLMLLCGLGGSAQSQVLAAANGTTALPEIEVVKPRAAQATRRPKTRVTSGNPRATPAAPPPVSPAAQLAAKTSVFDQARGNLYTTVGTTSNTISHQTIQDLPQGDNQPVEHALLQAPGVSQDSAASGLLHVRNDHANVQFRINGVMLPDGLSGFGSLFDTSFGGTLALGVGALPAEFGQRTVGLVDITTRNDLFNNSGSVSVYGGSHGTITPSVEYGGTFGGNCAATPATTPGYVKAPPAAAD